MSQIIKPGKVLIRNKEALDLNSLDYFVMRYVWEQDLMTKDEIALLQKSIVNWHNHAQFAEDMDLMYVLGCLSKIIKWRDEGKYDAAISLYKEHGIDWKKVYNIPGAHTQADIVRARMNYEQYRRDHPDTELGRTIGGE